MAQMRMTTQTIETGQVLRIKVPQWYREEEKLPSCEIVGTVGRLRAQAFDFHSGYAVVRESDECLRCQRLIDGAILRRIGYCSKCAPLVGAPSELEIDRMEMALVKRVIHNHTPIKTSIQKAAASVLNVLKESPIKATPAPAPAAKPAAPRPISNAALQARLAQDAQALTKTSVFVRQGNIYIKVPRQRDMTIYNACKRVGGGRWNDDQCAWTYAARPGVAARIQNIFAGITIDMTDAEFQALVQEASKQGGAVRVKLAREEDLKQPTGIRYPLWLHQLRAYAFALLFKGCGLFMEMGCGKSLSSIAIIAERKPKSVLIVCPKGVVDVWPREFEKHALFDYEICALNTRASVAKKVTLAKEALARGAKRGVPTIVVINYEAAIRPPMGPKYKKVPYTDSKTGKQKTKNVLDQPGFIASHKFDMIIADEAHKLMHPTSLTSKVFGYFSPTATYRLGLTGTPIAHDPLNIWAIYRFIDPDVFPMSFTAFRDRYAIMGGYMNRKVLAWKNLDELHQTISEHSFQVTKEVLNLPPQVHSTRYGQLSATERAKYKEMYDLLEIDVILKAAKAFTGDKTRVNDEGDEVLTDEYADFLATKNIKAPNVLAKLMKLAQITSGFVQDEEGTVHEIGTSKLELLDETLDEIDPSEPMVIFARFKRDIAVVKERLKARGIKVAEMSGARNELKDWQQGKFTAIVVQVQSGGEGIDLTHCGDKICRYCLYFSKDFNWSKYNQSLSRIHRPGQTETTYFIHLAIESTVDLDIEKTMETRGSLATAVLTGKALHLFNSTNDSDDAADTAEEDAGGDDEDDEEE